MSLFKLGFRPFYALASIFAITAIGLWLLSFAGFFGTGTYLHGVNWHSHEMLFGFATAVLAGFLLTAVQNWTELPTPTGLSLAMLAALWLVARVLIFVGPAPIAAFVDVLFLPALGFAIARPILQSRNQRNYKLLAILTALAVLHVLYHLASLTYVDVRMARISLLAGIDVFTILMAIVGGRVIPVFTRNAIAGAKSRNELWLEAVTFGGMLAVVFVTVASNYFPVSPLVLTVLCVTAAATHAMRLALWEPGKTLDLPLLWMMPVAYSWIPFAFLLRAMAAANVIAAGAWIHAITAGAVTSLMLAMMMRSSLGHTGRALVAGRVEIAAFLFLQTAAIIRVLASIFAADTYRLWIFASGLMWALAFILFAIRYVPMLSRPRVSD